MNPVGIRGSGGDPPHRQEGRTSHRNKPQSESSHRRHVDPRTNTETRSLKLKSKQDVFSSIGWTGPAQSCDKVLTVWHVEMGKLFRVFLLLASWGFKLPPQPSGVVSFQLPSSFLPLRFNPPLSKTLLNPLPSRLLLSPLPPSTFNPLPSNFLLHVANYSFPS